MEAGRFLTYMLEIHLKGNSGKISDGHEEHVIGKWREDDPCYKVAKNVAELCSSVLWKVEIANNKIGYLA